MNNQYTEDPTIAEYIRSAEFKRRMADADIRRNPNIQKQMRDLIADLGDLILDHATSITEAENGSLFDRDQHADTLVWLLAEFLSRAEFSREDWGEAIVKGHQLTEDHAAEWFAE